MTTKRYSIIRAKYSSKLYRSNQRCKIGEIIVRFPFNWYISTGTDGKKNYCSTYVRLNDVHKYPELGDLRQRIIKDYGIDPDTYGKNRTIIRG